MDTTSAAAVTSADRQRLDQATRLETIPAIVTQTNYLHVVSALLLGPHARAILHVDMDAFSASVEGASDWCLIQENYRSFSFQSHGRAE